MCQNHGQISISLQSIRYDKVSKNSFDIPRPGIPEKQVITAEFPVLSSRTYPGNFPTTELTRSFVCQGIMQWTSKMRVFANDE